MTEQNLLPNMSANGSKAYTAQIDALLSKLPDAPGDTECAFYDSLIDDDDAKRIGAGVESAGVLEACIHAVEAALPSVTANKIGGYGPLRLHYLLKVSRKLADKVAVLDAALSEAAGPGATGTTTIQGARDLRCRAYRALKNLTKRGNEPRARVRKAFKDERPDERVRSLEALAQELESHVAKVPQRVATDAGATPELMQGLRSYAKAVLDAKAKAKNTNSPAFSAYDGMNVLDGHIVYELRVLSRSLRDVSKHDKSVPAIRVKLVKRPGRKKDKEPVVKVLKKVG